MRGLVQRVRDSDPEVAAALAIIAAFDDLIARQADLAMLAHAAADMTGCGVAIIERWNDRQLFVQSDDAARDPSVADTILSARLPAHGAVEVSGRLVASIETADGAIGAVWLEAPGRPWRATDRMVIERLAAGSAIDAVAFHQQRQADAATAPADRDDAAEPTTDAPARDGSVGVSGLLTQVPATTVADLPDLVALRTVAAEHPEDLVLLEAYCAAASMRTVAKELGVHHSSVDHRLKRIGRAMDIELTTSAGRLRALLALELLHGDHRSVEVI